MNIKVSKLQHLCNIKYLKLGAKCRYCMFFFILNVMITSACLANIQTERFDSLTYYRKHFIVVVDQTIQGSSFANTIDLYVQLRDLLTGSGQNTAGLMSESRFPNEPDFFNEKTDQLSLFAFGIAGSGINYTADYRKINLMAHVGKISEEQMNQEITNALIHVRSSLHGSNKSLDDFLAHDLRSLFDGTDPLLNRISNYSGISLTSYVYPVILNKINTSVPASEYVILIVSDFMAGDGKSTDNDNAILSQLLAQNNRYILGFNQKINQLRNSFSYDLSDINIILKPKPSKKNPRVLGGEMIPRALKSTGAKVGGVELKQTRWKSDVFNCMTGPIQFMKNDQVQVSQIALEIRNSYDSIVYTGLIASVVEVDKLYDGSVYKLPTHSVTLKDANQGDSYTFNYLIYATINDNDGREIIPCVFIASVYKTLGESCFKSAPQENILTIIIFCILVLGFSGVVLYFLYNKRGKNRKVTIEPLIQPISPTKYMDVKDCKVTAYDCWYQQDLNDKQRTIVLKYKLNFEKLPFAKKCEYVLGYKVEDVDQNDVFAFRPNGHGQDGSNRKTNVTYYFDRFKYESSPYNKNVSIIAYVDGDKIPNLTDFDNILKMKLTVVLRRVDNSNAENENCPKVTENVKPYSFIVKPAIEDSNCWVAFDPGTTGSCIAYGVTRSPYEKDEIKIVESDEGVMRSPIIQSVVHIPDTSVIFKGIDKKTEEYEWGSNRDFITGYLANQESYNKFQSIKKLLGYKSELKVENSIGKTAMISGQDVAHLLIKGLYKELKDHVCNLNDKDQGDTIIKQRFLKNGYFQPQRAVVAVPNNYTLPRIQDMVDSIKRLGEFCEVHYLYESEGVLMTFLRKEMSNINQLDNHIVVVYDMGGATINATAFRLAVDLNASGNLNRVTVDTLAKVGYCIGGDDIDYAIIQFFYGIPSVKSALNNDGIEELFEHQVEHKNKLIELARKIKLDWIDHCQTKTEDRADNRAVNIETFWNFLCAECWEVFPNMPSDPSDEDKEYIKIHINDHPLMNKFVFNNVCDAVNELMLSLEKTAPETKTESIKLIMSGRSTLYPRIKDSVIKAINENGHQVDFWEGFSDINGYLDDNKVKTAVAEGSCWYAMYSSQIDLNHNRVTSTFGYIDQENLKNVFVPLVECGQQYDLDEKVIGNKAPHNIQLNYVKFVQMLGLNFQDIIDKDIKHKMNILDEVESNYILTQIQDVGIEVDQRDNYDFTIHTIDGKTLHKSNASQRATGNIRTEVADEQSTAYVFSTKDTNNYHSRTRTDTHIQHHLHSSSKSVDSQAKTIRRR